MATVGRANVYERGLSETLRKPLQYSLRSQLELISKEYECNISEDAHERNIVKLSTYLTSNHFSILRNGQFRIGTAQKALNLYLKYLWCFGKIPEPPHCPFDFQIIKKLPNYIGPSWTALNSIENYRELVIATKSVANGVSLANWELQTYNNDQPLEASKLIKQEVGVNFKNKSAKVWVRELLSVEGAKYTIAELVNISCKTESNIKTALSDLRSSVYCGGDGIFITESIRINGKLYYRKAR